MGTPFACIYATIYYWMHEKHVLIPKYHLKMPLIARFIDDLICIIEMGGEDGMNDNEVDNLIQDLDTFGQGILTWDADKPSNTVDYLDITIKIDNGMVSTRTYRKPLNTYSYLPPHSVHPRGTIKGMVYGMLYQYFRQNSNREDYFENALQLYGHLQRVGWPEEILNPLFITAHDRILQRQISDEMTSTTSESSSTTKQYDDTSLQHTIILHHEFHDKGINRKEHRDIYDRHLGSLLAQDPHDGGLGIVRTIVAYHRAPNLRDLLQSTILKEVKGREVSTYFGG